MAAGQSPESLWDQTPRTHEAVLEGVNRRLRQDVARDVALAWRVENFRRAGKKLKALDHYLKQLDPPKVQTADDVIAIFDRLASRGRAKVIDIAEDVPDAG